MTSGLRLWAVMVPRACDGRACAVRDAVLNYHLWQGLVPRVL